MVDHLLSIHVQEWIEAPTVAECMGWVDGVARDAELYLKCLAKAAEVYNAFLIGLQEYHVDIQTPAVHKFFLTLSFHVRVLKETWVGGEQCG